MFKTIQLPVFLLGTDWDLYVCYCRYVKLLVPYEHGSYFSELNTKILTAGAVLLLVVIYMGPVYGWGEYSTLRGELLLLCLTPCNKKTKGEQTIIISVQNMSILRPITTLGD